MWTTLSLILTILLLIICCIALAWRYFRLLERMLTEERTTNRDLLGLPSPSQTPTTSVPRPSQRSPEPEPDPLDEFEALSPEIQESMLREYQEHLSQFPKNIRTHPDVPEITPGLPIPVS